MSKNGFSTREGFALSEQGQALGQQVSALPIPLIFLNSPGQGAGVCEISPALEVPACGSDPTFSDPVSSVDVNGDSH